MKNLLCINCQKNPIFIKKRQLCNLCYGRFWWAEHPGLRAKRDMINKEKIKAQHKRWEAKNKEKKRAIGRKSSKKWRSEPKNKLADNIRTAMWRSLHGLKGGRHWETLVGYTLNQLKKHLEKRFVEGMSWENYGKYWNIDHIIPISVFNFDCPEDIDFQRCWTLKNLRPIEAKKNFSKQAKINKSFQPSFLFKATQII